MSLSSARTRMDPPGNVGQREAEEAEADRRVIRHDDGTSRPSSRPSKETVPLPPPGPPGLDASKCGSGKFGGRRRHVSSKNFVSEITYGDEEATQKTSGHLSSSASEMSESFGSVFDPSHRGGGSDAQKKQPAKKSLEKRRSGSDMLEVDEGDIDFVVSLKALLAEAKSDADAASVQNASLVKENVRLKHCLEARSSRVKDLETKLKHQQNLAAATAKIASRLEASNLLLKQQLTAARKEVKSAATCTSTTDKAKSSSHMRTNNLELSVMRRRVDDLEKQNRMLRSELVGAGHELDEQRYQHQETLSTLNLVTTGIGYPHDREVNFPPGDSAQHVVEGGGGSNWKQVQRSPLPSNDNSSGHLFLVDGELSGTIDCV